MATKVCLKDSTNICFYVRREHKRLPAFIFIITSVALPLMVLNEDALDTLLSFLYSTHTISHQGILIRPPLLLEHRGKKIHGWPERPQARREKGNHLICCCFHKSGPSHQFYHIFESTCYWQCVRGEKWSLLAKLFHFLKIKLFIVQAAICPP